MPYFKDFRGWTNLPPPYYKVFAVVDVITCYLLKGLICCGHSVVGSSAFVHTNESSQRQRICR
jgi:hypothetical protein